MQSFTLLIPLSVQFWWIQYISGSPTRYSFNCAALHIGRDTSAGVTSILPLPLRRHFSRLCFIHFMLSEDCIALQQSRNIEVEDVLKERGGRYQWQVNSSPCLICIFITCTYLSMLYCDEWICRVVWGASCRLQNDTIISYPCLYVTVSDAAFLKCRNHVALIDYENVYIF